MIEIHITNKHFGHGVFMSLFEWSNFQYTQHYFSSSLRQYF